MVERTSFGVCALTMQKYIFEIQISTSTAAAMAVATVNSTHTQRTTKHTSLSLYSAPIVLTLHTSSHRTQRADVLNHPDVSGTMQARARENIITIYNHTIAARFRFGTR